MTTYKTTKVIGLIQLQDHNAFDEYRSQVGKTVEKHQGTIHCRGTITEIFWNELEIAPFTAYVELEFPNAQSAHAWANSAEYKSLVPIRNQAMKLTLFGITT